MNCNDTNCRKNHGHKHIIETITLSDSEDDYSEQNEMPFNKSTSHQHQSAPFRLLQFSKTEIHSTTFGKDGSTFTHEPVKIKTETVMDNCPEPFAINNSNEWDTIQGSSTLIQRTVCSKILHDYNHGLPKSKTESVVNDNLPDSTTSAKINEEIVEDPIIPEVNVRLLRRSIDTDKSEVSKATSFETTTCSKKGHKHKKRPPRKLLTAEQKEILMESFKRNTYPEKFEKERLAEATGLSTTQVQGFFGNQRLKGKTVHSYDDDYVSEKSKNVNRSPTPMDPSMPLLSPQVSVPPFLLEHDQNLKNTLNSGTKRFMHSTDQYTTNLKRPRRQKNISEKNLEILRKFWEKTKRPIQLEIMNLKKETKLDKDVILKWFETENKELEESSEQSNYTEDKREIGENSFSSDIDVEGDPEFGNSDINEDSSDYNMEEEETEIQRNYKKIEKLSSKELEEVWGLCKLYFEKLMALPTDEAVTNASLRKDTLQLRDNIDSYDCPFTLDQSELLNELNLNFVKKNRQEIWDMDDDDEDDQDVIAFVRDTLSCWCIIIIYAKIANIGLQDAVDHFSQAACEPYEWTIPMILDKSLDRSEDSE